MPINVKFTKKPALIIAIVVSLLLAFLFYTGKINEVGPIKKNSDSPKNNDTAHVNSGIENSPGAVQLNVGKARDIKIYPASPDILTKTSK